VSVERLQRIIAHAGLASRRQAEQWILEGRVTVNGERVQELGTKADAARDSIRVNGRMLRPAPARACLAFHKPAGVITTMRDTEGRPAVADYLRFAGYSPGVVPAGRLDYATSGLLLLTNDGDLAHRLTHPRYGVPKTYEVKLSSMPSEVQLERLRHGVRLDDGVTAPAAVRVARRLKQKVWLRVELREGRNREIRRMVEAVGQTVERLVRVRFGPIALGTLESGAIRPLTGEEETRLRRAVGLATPETAAPRKGKRYTRDERS